MAVRELVLCGDKRLRIKCEKVKKITKSVKDLITDLCDTLEAANGLGLAAPQIGSSKSVAVIDLSKMKENVKLILINPVIEKRYGPKELFSEGCLSIPELFTEVSRPTIIDLKYDNQDGQQVSIKGISGLTARVVQHEVDHLNGILFIDHLSAEEKQKHQTIIDAIKNKSKMAAL